MRINSLAEAVGFYLFVAAAIWGGQTLGLKGQVWIGAVLLMTFAGLSSRRHGDDLARLGLGKPGLKDAARLTVVYVVPILAGLFVWALTRPAPPLPKIIFGLIGYPVWAFAQEYALLGFAANRLEEGVGPRPLLVSCLNGVLFSLIHSPNPMLMTACFVSGSVFTRIFLKTRNVYPLALAHALGGFLLSWIFLDQYNAMMVGPAYWKWAGIPGPHP